MIVVHDKFGKKYRLKFEKKSNKISIYFYDGKKKYFVSVVDIYKEKKTAEIQEFILEKWPKDYRNRDLGTKITTLLEEQLRNFGIVTIIGNVVEMDKGAEVFWKKQGYEITPYYIGLVRFTIKKDIF